MALSKKRNYQFYFSFFLVFTFLFAVSCRENPETAELKKIDQKVSEYVKLCEDLKDAPMVARTAHGPVWFVDDEASHKNRNDPLRLDGQSYPISETKTVVCLFHGEKEVGECNYSEGLDWGRTRRIVRYETANIILALDLESRQKIAQTTVVKAAGDCPEFLMGEIRAIKGGDISVDEIRDWFSDHWSP